jgi:serine/threonine protein kinase
MPDGRVKLADFGFAARLEEGANYVRGWAGTNAYAAPEVHMRRERSALSDVWSLGVLSFFMMTCEVNASCARACAPIITRGPQFPFGDDGVLDERACEKRKARRRAEDMLRQRGCSDEAVSFIMSLLVPESRRPSVALALQHPWITCVCGGFATPRFSPASL